jgi:hypothetical protein
VCLVHVCVCVCVCEHACACVQIKPNLLLLQLSTFTHILYALQVLYYSVHTYRWPILNDLWYRSNFNDRKTQLHNNNKLNTNMNILVYTEKSFLLVFQFPLTNHLPPPPHLQNSMFCTKTKLHGLSLQANYTYRATAACRQS